MVASNLYTLDQASRILSLGRHIVTFLMAHHEVPYRQVGRAKLIDESGLHQLRAHADDYRRKVRAVAV